MIDLENQKKEYVLQMGELQVCAHPAVITCFGLGSCVGLFLFDRVNKIGGGAHIMFSAKLESDQAFPKSFYAAYAVEELIEGMTALGANIAQLRAKLIGGANLFGMESFSTGKRNTEAIQALVKQHGIYMAGTDLGGNIGRTAKFNTSDGQVLVLSQAGNYII